MRNTGKFMAAVALAGSLMCAPEDIAEDASAVSRSTIPPPPCDESSYAMRLAEQQIRSRHAIYGNYVNQYLSYLEDSRRALEQDGCQQTETYVQVLLAAADKHRTRAVEQLTGRMPDVQIREVHGTLEERIRMRTEQPRDEINNLQEARQLYQDAQTIMSQLPDVSVEIRFQCLYGFGYTLELQGEYREARTLQRLAKTHLPSSEYRRMVQERLDNLDTLTGFRE